MNEYQEIIRDVNKDIGWYSSRELFDDGYNYQNIADQIDLNLKGQYELFGFGFGNYVLASIIAVVMIILTTIYVNRNEIKSEIIKTIKSFTEFVKLFLRGKAKISFTSIISYIFDNLFIVYGTLYLSIIVYGLTFAFSAVPVLIADKYIETDYEIKTKWYNSLSTLIGWCAKYNTNQNTKCITSNRTYFLDSSSFIQSDIKEKNAYRQEVFSTKNEIYTEYARTVKRKKSDASNIIRNQEFITRGYMPRNYNDEISDKLNFINNYKKDMPNYESRTASDYNQLYIINDNNSDEEEVLFNIGRLNYDDIYYINTLCGLGGCKMDIQFAIDNDDRIIEDYFIHPFEEPKPLRVSYEYFKNEGYKFLRELADIEESTFSSIEELEKDYEIPEFVLQVKNSIVFKPIN